MIDILGFFKKKQPAALPEVQESGPVIEEQVQAGNIAIHVMPQRFRAQANKANQAKTAGLIIISGGAVFLVVISVLLYIYLFKGPAGPAVEQEPISQSGQPQGQEPVPNQIGGEQATTTGTMILPGDNSLASSTATSTSELPENINQEPGVGLKAGLDSDVDGLTDWEEIVFGTGSTTPDTDGDTFLDGAEVANLYNPAGAGKLADSPAITIYENKTFSYSALFPKFWQVSTNGGDDSVMFRSGNNQFMQIIVQPNPEKQALDQWYNEQLGVSLINDFDRLSGSGWQGLKNPDGLTVYLMDSGQKYIFTLTYNPGGSNILEYANLYSLMIKTFTIKD